MAEFVRPDGKTIIQKQVILPRADEFSLVGRIVDFQAWDDPMTRESKVTLTLTISESERTRASGLVPHLQMDGKIQIRLVR
jgi:hypothetical protein